MKKISNDPDFKGFLWEKGEQINLTHLGAGKMLNLLPIEAHVKEDGAIGDKPSFCFVFEETFSNMYAVAQISEKMFKPIIEALGYRKT